MGFRDRGRSLFFATLLAGRFAFAAEEEVSPWDLSANVREGVGYKDNILLSDLNKEGSVFSLTTIDFFAYHFPLNGWEFTSFISGEDRRYWQSSNVDKEQLLIASADLKRKFNDAWKAGLRLQYIYNDEVFDASVTEGIPVRVAAKLHQISGGPSAIWKLPAKRRLEFSAELARQDFEGSVLDSSWQGGPKILFGQGYGHKSDFTATLQWRDRSYDNRHAPGRADSLHFDSTLFELGVKHYWDEERAWSSRGRAGVEWNWDNGNGFYNFRRWRLSHELGFTRKTFEAKLETKFLHYEYESQISLNGDLRRRTELVFGGRAEQELRKRLKLFAEYEYEWVMDSDFTDRYRAHTVSAGLDFQIK
jgi:hypothetical protein